MALLRTKELAVNIKLAGGAPDSVIDNSLRITSDSSQAYDQGIDNSQDDVATQTLSPAPTIHGTSGGSFAFNGNLESTLGFAEPSISPALQICGMSKNTAQRIVLDVMTNVEVLLEITGSVSGASGTIYGFRADTKEIQVKLDDVLLPFEAGDVITIEAVDHTVASVLAEQAFLYLPDTEQYADASVFMHYGDNVDAIKGVKANITLTANFGEFMKYALSGVGKTDTENRGEFTRPVANYAAVKPGVFKDAEMRIRWEGGEYIPANTSVSYNFGSQPVLMGDSNDSTGLYGAEITSRGEAAGSLTIYKPDYSVFNAYDLQESDTTIELTYWHGGGITGRSVFIYQKAQMGQLSDVDTNGAKSITMPLNSTGSADDEQYILFI